MSTHVVLQPEHVTVGSFVDAAPHRAALPPIYNQYTRCAADPVYARDREAHIALFRPLFTTAFLLDDFLAEQDGFGARQVVLSSASSKTALGLAFLLHGRGAGSVIGLTSPRHFEFVGSTDYYDGVLTYDRLGDLLRKPTVFVDFAGNGEVLAGIHRNLNDQLRHSAQVGVTHWENMHAPADLPGPTPTFFFAPTQLQKRVQEWGADQFQRRIGAAMQRFLTSSGAWMRVVEHRGPDAVIRLYREMVGGHIDPAEGNIAAL
jgi:hypothetical protein